MPRNLTGIILGAGLALGVAGCNHEAAGPGQPALNAAQADSLAQAVTAELDAMVQGAGIGYYEKGQGNMHGSIWEQRDRYFRNSPLFLFDRVDPAVIGPLKEKVDDAPVPPPHEHGR